MIGLFQEHGPCRITNDSSSVTLNSQSWNNKVNVLYIDQPVGVGFSHGTLKVGTSQQAAADIWIFMQIFLKDGRFSKYQKNNLALWTESYDVSGRLCRICADDRDSQLRWTLRTSICSVRLLI